MRSLVLLFGLTTLGFGCAATTPAAQTASPAPTQQLSVTSDQPGNVFLQGEPIGLRVTGATSSAHVSVVDYEGKELPAQLGADGTLDLSSLPRGYYEVRVEDGQRKAQTSVAIASAPHPNAESPLAVDAAHSELIPPERFAAGAELLRRAGFTWVRERINWPEMEPQRGTYRWGKYEACINEEAKRGMKVVGVFHHTPAWARADKEIPRCPDDLRDIYNFARAAARQFRGKVAAWEVWNEADAALFSPETASDYSAFLKAAYLGFKAGDPQTLVTQVSLAASSGRFAETLYRNGTSAYFDVFNYHIYANPADYAKRAQGHLALLKKYGNSQAPIWITEAGIIMQATSGALSPADQKRQAEFIPRSYALSLAGGTNRHFFFLFPHYLENGIEYGVMNEQGTVYPGYAALATANDLLGAGRYRGEVALAGGTGLRAHLFDNGEDETLVLWRDGEAAEVALPAGAAQAKVFNCVGAELPALTAGKPMLRVGKSPLYLRAARGAFTPTPPAIRPAASAKPKAVTESEKLVLRLQMPKETARKATDEYEVPVGKPVPLGVEVYNLGNGPQSGTVRLQAPAGWQLSPATFPIRLEPMGRQQLQAKITARPRPDSGALRGEIVRQGGAKWGAGPVELNLTLAPEARTPTAEAALNLDSPDRWTDNIAPSGMMTRTAATGGGVEFGARFQSAGDHWVFPTASLTPPANWTKYDGISLEIMTDSEDPETQLRLMVGEKRGALYFTDTPLPQSRTWRKVFVPFRGLAPASFAPADPNSTLDLDQVVFLRFGAITKRTEWKARVRNFRLVRYQP